MSNRLCLQLHVSGYVSLLQYSKANRSPALLSLATAYKVNFAKIRICGLLQANRPTESNPCMAHLSAPGGSSELLSSYCLFLAQVAMLVCALYIGLLAVSIVIANCTAPVGVKTAAVDRSNSNHRSSLEDRTYTMIQLVELDEVWSMSYLCTSFWAHNLLLLALYCTLCNCFDTVRKGHRHYTVFMQELMLCLW